MAKLFVIGNGFDRGHGLKTSYDNFREYYLAKFPGIKTDELTIPASTRFSDGEERYDDEEVLSMLFYLINSTVENNKEWKDIETSIGEFDYGEFFDDSDDYYNEEEDYEWELAAKNENIASDLIIPTTRIQNYFSEWIDTIKINSINPKEEVKNLMNKEDKYLTFNYTETLEKVYDINFDSICHVHGKQGEEIFFGHGNEEDYTDEYMISNIGSQDNLSDIERQLKKDTNKALRQNMNFFESLRKSDINRVYSYGFSFNKVDSIYMKEICKRINTENVIWYFNDYDNERKLKQYQEQLRECGFLGCFSRFHIN